MALKLKSFSQPDLLKRIHPETLIRLLEPHRLFFDMKGFTLPAADGGEIDYLRLAAILAQPDEDMPSDLVEALYVVGSFSGDGQFDELLELAERAALAVDGEATAPDLAARLYLHDPQLLERKQREALFEKRKNFESYRAADPGLLMDIAGLPADLSSLEADLNEYFEARKRGGGCQISRADSPGEVRFLVRHGQPCRREPSRRGGQSTCTFFRPEKTDAVILDFVHNEMRISASTLPDLRELRMAFGRRLFGDANRFVFAQKYTLDPLKTDAEAALGCRDIEGIESIRLREIEYNWEGAFEHAEIHRAEDLLKALIIIGREVEQRPPIRKAVFKVKLHGEKKPRTVTIRAGNKAGYNRGEEAMVIEEWLRARGFVRGQEEPQHANADQAVARA